MHILQIHNFYKYRGGECEVVAREHELLTSAGHTVSRFTADSGELDTLGWISKALALSRITFNPRSYRTLLATLSDTKPDIVHVHNVFPLLSPSVYTACRSRGIPIIQTVHNYRFICPAGTMYRAGRICEECATQGTHAAVAHRCVHKSFVISLQYARAIAHARRPAGFLHAIDRYIALNQFGRRMLVAAGVEESRIDVLSNYAVEIAKRRSLPKGDYVLYLGRLAQEKGLELLLEAAAELPDISFVIAGDGPYTPDTQHHTNVQWVGRISGERKRQLVASAQALVIPSVWYENNPMVVIEALSQGTPIIASSIGGLPEMFENGQSGYLFAPGDKVDLIRCITRTMGADTGDRLAEAALEYAQTHYSAQDHLAKLEKIYQKTLHDKVLTASSGR